MRRRFLDSAEPEQHELRESDRATNAESFRSGGYISGAANEVSKLRVDGLGQLDRVASPTLRDRFQEGFRDLQYSKSRGSPAEGVTIRRDRGSGGSFNP
ncbi:MAG: hypothetical protein HOW73_00780 [Polyangiaceae bacterium]|nr:hypothetical protein [Polyangiaceae bacterium]